VHSIPRAITDLERPWYTTPADYKVHITARSAHYKFGRGGGGDARIGIDEFVSGDKYGDRLSLKSPSKTISVTFGGDDPLPNESSDEMHLLFRDAEIARRVGTAFLHAAELCKQKEVF
jgi:hypothetical protein